MTTQIQLRRDSAADWTSNNPTLAEGEVGLELDTGKFKWGDGATAWNGLSYIDPLGGTSLTTGTTFGGDISGAYNAISVDKASGDFQLTGDATITDTGTLSDYALGGSVSVLRWNGASALTLTGATGGADGRLLFIMNVTAAQTLTLTHDATSTAANRFYLANGVAQKVHANSGVLAIYDSTSSRWRVVTRGKEFTIGGVLLDPSGARSIPVWYAPFPCEIIGYRARVVGGTNAVTNAQVDATDILTGDLTTTPADGWESGTIKSDGTEDVTTGEVITLEVVSISGSVTEIVWQITLVGSV